MIMPKQLTLAPPICRMAREVMLIGRRVMQKGVVSERLSVWVSKWVGDWVSNRASSTYFDFSKLEAVFTMDRAGGLARRVLSRPWAWPRPGAKFWKSMSSGWAWAGKFEKKTLFSPYEVFHGKLPTISSKSAPFSRKHHQMYKSKLFLLFFLIGAWQLGPSQLLNYRFQSKLISPKCSACPNFSIGQVLSCHPWHAKK